MAKRYYLSQEQAKNLKEAYDKAQSICSSHQTTPDDVRVAFDEFLVYINSNIFSTPIPDDAEDAADRFEREMDPISGNSM